MKAKFEKLSNQLFKEQVDKKQISKIIGGGDDITYKKHETYIGQNGDYVECGEDYNGTYCDDIVFY